MEIEKIFGLNAMFPMLFESEHPHPSTNRARLLKQFSILILLFQVAWILVCHIQFELPSMIALFENLFLNHTISTPMKPWLSMSSVICQSGNLVNIKLNQLDLQPDLST